MKFKNKKEYRLCPKYSKSKSHCPYCCFYCPQAKDCKTTTSMDCKKQGPKASELILLLRKPKIEESVIAYHPRTHQSSSYSILRLCHHP